ncbi:Teichoic-acid-transporting ATPase [Oleidesulfovibrio alaskensis G20]|jgi:lipopolysaccharide transport system ATP-binding protein|uniref:Teichoic-acid-transporting ATPase n=1 Tax=Oleidesulfovibrio alaskensis (strain ATCC BAA-1058 / DSM 17464 / G20) TaxID=207559 RepID=Q314J4_OLEA2|nr:ABC transporter ATP-binding protein [Oleidesulfovibrio alaskensis]ABB37652.1 Teichoic-acid-transporting ATPase [Oleidesulfovibrio alaskensis G20]MBG0773573.1 ABC transporter ATP-binding protein [Oleidesulfovibrio alaskensis]
MSAEPIIQVENLSKMYRLGLKNEIHDSIAEAAVSWLKTPVKNYRNLKSLNTFGVPVDEDDPGVLWALRDVSFEVAEGEVLGIIGRNGAGKSTLLKVLSRITEPTRGRVIINGRVASLLEVGTGFHPDLTGRENVFMNGSILGMRKGEIAAKFDEIVDFAGLDRFIDTPIKRYSSGMVMRLAFSVAAHLEPEILIIDEVLAVGDAAFQKKCLDKMHKVASGGRTVLFVSHQLNSVSALCGRVMHMDSGRIIKNGDTRQVIDHYLTSAGFGVTTALHDRKDRCGAGHVRFVNSWIEDMQGNRLASAVSGEPVRIALEYQSHAEESFSDVKVYLRLYSMLNKPAGLFSNVYTEERIDISAGENGVLYCTVPRMMLNGGRYFFHLKLEAQGRQLDHIENAGYMEVEAGNVYANGKMPNDQWVYLHDYGWSGEPLHKG